MCTLIEIRLSIVRLSMVEAHPLSKHGRWSRFPAHGYDFQLELEIFLWSAQSGNLFRYSTRLNRHFPPAAIHETRTEPLSRL